MTDVEPPKIFPGTELAESPPRLKLLVVGAPGVGKTYLCESFAHDSRAAPLLYLDASGGTAGILPRLHAAGATVRSCGHAASIISKCEELLKQDYGFGTLVIDDFSEAFGLTRAALARQLHGSKAEAIEPVEYPILYERICKVYRLLRKLAESRENGGAGMHIVVTAWPEDEVVPGGGADGPKKVVPLFSGKFGFLTVGYFDSVGVLVRGRRRPPKGEEAGFQNTLVFDDPRYEVKDRYDTFVPKVEQPTATKLLDLLDKHAVSQNKAKEIA